MLGDGDGPAVRANVAPAISAEKAMFARRQLLSTLLGGARCSPEMTVRAHLVQGVMWVVPPTIALALAQGMGGEPGIVRAAVAAALGVVFCLLVETARWFICHKGREAQASPGGAWFADYDEADFANLWSPATCRALSPPKRSVLHAVTAIGLSASLLGVAANALEFGRVHDAIGGDGDAPSFSALVLSLLCALAVGSAHFGLVGSPPIEVTAHKDRDPHSLAGLVVEMSRPLLVVILLFPLLARYDLPRLAGAALLVAVATLPPLWLLGVAPQVDALFGWALEQLEVHGFGGSPMPLTERLVAGMAMSIVTALAMAFATSAAQQAMRGAAAQADMAPLVSAVVGLPAAAVLAALPPNRAARGEHRLHPQLCALLAAVAQALVGLAIALGLAAVAGAEALAGGASGTRRPSAGAESVFATRLIVESAIVLFVVSLVVVFRILGRRRPCPGGSLAGGSPMAAVAGASRRLAKAAAVLQALVRVVMFAHAAALGANSAYEVRLKPGSGICEAALLLRAWRVALTAPMRAAVDAWIVGMVDLLLGDTGLEARSADGFLAVSWGVRLLVISVACERLRLLAAYVQYAWHLTRVTTSSPKLRHPWMDTILSANMVLFPLVVLVLVLAALLESPLVALYTLPIFLVGYPRMRRGHPELSEGETSSTKGVEGLFYKLLAPSLLRSLAPRWRCGALPSRPGSMLLCRSHERLICLVRVLGAGFGWVSVELRGLEMQEPTSCHHVEAGRIDDAFAEALSGKAALVWRPQPRAGSDLARGGHAAPAAGDEAASTSPPQPDLFVLTPICEVPATGYEQTQLSLRGIIDNADTLRQVHRLFLKTLVWVMAQELRENREDVSAEWLDCPMKSSDAHMVVNLLKTTQWPRRIAEELGLDAPASKDKAGSMKRTGSRTSAWVAAESTPGAANKADLESPRTVPTSTRDVDPTPPPPPGGPPTPTMIRQGRGSPQPSRIVHAGARAGSPIVSEGASQGWGDTTESLDALMDMVLDLAPGTSGEGEAGQTSQTSVAATTIGVPRPRTVCSEDSGRSPSPILRPPKQLAPLEATAVGRHCRRQNSTDNGARFFGGGPALPAAAFGAGRGGGDRRQELGRQGGDALRSTAIARSVWPPQPELTDLARLVVQAYIAVDVAPTAGQIPEALGPAHVFQVFAGQLAQSTKAAEVLWLESRPRIRDLALRAFRYALKVTVDCASMAEDASSLEYSEISSALDELERNWHLGEEDTASWQEAVEQRTPNMMALRRRGVADISILRLCLREDGVRVGELRSEVECVLPSLAIPSWPEVVQSIWAAGSLELRYFTNDDDERYSIQAHPTLLRNMIVQSAEYPIYVSPPTTVWM